MNIIINDIKYDIKIKNKNEERTERIIFFCYKNNIIIIKDIKEYFVDITSKIIPKNYHPYKQKNYYIYTFEIFG